jgi:hypothetical protein
LPPDRRKQAQISSAIPQETIVKGSSILAAVLLMFTLPASARTSNENEPPALRSYVQALRDEGRDPLAFTIDRLRDHDLLIFDDGLHTAVEPFEFYQKLVREPAFHRQVKSIFLEVIPINLQPHIDAYFDGERENRSLLYPVFQDDYSGSGFPYKTYFDLFHVVYEVNRQLPKAERLRVIAVSNPVHWTEIKTAADLALFRKSLAGRDALMYEIILNELDHFRSGRKGIFLTNTRHAYKGIHDLQQRLYWNCGTFFHGRHPGKTYSLRCHTVLLQIDRVRAGGTATKATAEGMERFVYSWVRAGHGRWDEAWQQLGNRPTAVTLAGNIFGREPYVGNHMLDAAPGQTMADAYDAVLLLAPLELLRQTALVSEIYTPAFKQELVRRYRLAHTPADVADQLKVAGVSTLEELVDKEHVAAPEQPLEQLKGLEPANAWRMRRSNL